MEKKIQQHYVWEHYLTAWCYNSKHLYCYRTEKSNAFSVNPEKIAKEKEFYKLKDVTPVEIELIEKLFIEHENNAAIREVNREWIKQFTAIFRVKELAELQGMKNDQLDNKIDALLTNMEEEYHTHLEKIAIPYLESLKNGQLNINDTDDSLVEFLIFLTTQYFRTKKIKMNILKVAKEFEDEFGVRINMESMWNISSHILATSFAYNLYLRKDNFKWSILNNKGNIPFITGDQPVINTLADYSSSTEATDLELYYPLTPDKALLISQVNYLDEPTNIEINEDEVRRYNYLILKASEEQVFSNSKEALEELKISLKNN